MTVRILLLFILVGSLVSTIVVAAPSPYFLGENAGVNVNPHNLSRQSLITISTIKASDTGDLNETRICVFCHTPHSATPDSPLWGRPDPELMSSFLMSTAAPTLQGTAKAAADYDSVEEYPNGASKLCLSCHDGATAIGTMVNLDITMTAGSDFITAGGMVIDNTSLATTHPISFIYNASVVTLLNAGPGGYVLNSPYLDGNNRMQCTTCHDPHFNSDWVDGVRRPPYEAGSTYDLPFWRGAGSNEAAEFDAICDGCHTASFDTPGTDPHGM